MELKKLSPQRHSVQRIIAISRIQMLGRFGGAASKAWLAVLRSRDTFPVSTFNLRLEFQTRASIKNRACDMDNKITRGVVQIVHTASITPSRLEIVCFYAPSSYYQSR